MAITNPSLIDGLDTNGTNQGTPDSALITDGYLFQSIPKSSDMNRYFKELYRYIHFLQETGISQWDNNISYNKYARVMRNGTIYKSKSDANIGNDPLSTSSWENSTITGQKNLIINGRKTIQQRASTGGTKQVIESNMNLGESYTLSFTGTSTATIHEFPIELSDYSTTIADAGTNTLATSVESGTTVTTTVGYYIAIEFSSTDFNNVQFEKGSIPTNFEVRHNELILCLPFYEHGGTTPERVWLSGSTTLGLTIGYSATKRKTPYLVLVGVEYTNASDLTGAAESTSFEISFIGTGDTGGSRVSFLWSVDSEIFNTSETYKEDRWFI